MKKSSLALIVFSATALGAFASGTEQTGPGDPKKAKQEEKSFSYSKNYFNIFSIFDWDEAIADTINASRPLLVQPRKEPATKPTN